MNKRLLVIGGTGYFGKSILDSFHRSQLASFGIGTVTVMARNTGKLKSEAPELLGSGVELIDADIATASDIPAADIVIHAAASTDASRYLERGAEERHNIQAGTFNYCDLAQIRHRGSKIVYVSSGAVYGTQPPDVKNIAEDYCIPDSNDIPVGKRDYAIAKRDAEAAVRQLASSNLDVAIARCFAFVGPWLPRNRHFAIGNFIADGLAGRSIQVKARGKVYRSYMHSDDLVEWLLRIAMSGSPECPVYNVGSDEEVLMAEAAKGVADYFGVSVAIPEITESSVDRYVPSIKKAQNDLGLTLKFDFLSAVKSTARVLQLR
jgi:nucleoside-diphosphate-sugar epimerase